MRVLVIEDDRDQASFINKVLSEAGHEVDLAENGADGLIKARDGDFDALVVDRMLPEDGLKLVEEYRNGAGRRPPCSSPPFRRGQPRGRPESRR